MANTTFEVKRMPRKRIAQLTQYKGSQGFLAELFTEVRTLEKELARTREALKKQGSAPEINPEDLL